MPTSNSNSGSRRSISLLLYSPSNSRPWRDDSSYGTRQNTTAEEQEYILLEEERHREQHQLQLIEQFVTFQAKFVTRLDRLTFAEKKQVVRLLVEEVLVDSVNESLMVKHVIPLDKRFPLRSGSSH